MDQSQANINAFQEFFKEILADIKTEYDSCFCMIDSISQTLGLCIFGYDSTYRKPKKGDRYDIRKPKEGFCDSFYIENWTCRQLWEAVEFMNTHCSTEAVNFLQDIVRLNIDPS